MAAYATFDGNPDKLGMFMTAFTVDGGRLWTERWGTPSGEAEGIDIDSHDTLYVGGVTHGGFDGVSAAGPNSYDLFVSRWWAATSSTFRPPVCPGTSCTMRPSST
jgi:hypothetical protein